MKHLLFLFGILVLAGCANEKSQEVTPAQLLLDLTNSERYTSTDEVAGWLINKDPSLRLVDVRDPAAYNAFTLPGAVNIPLDKILAPENRELLDCERYTVVFFSNDDLTAEQAWQLSRRNGCKSTYVMRGGLNEWTATILDPQDPGELASAEELELYQFRKAVCQYFIGGSEELFQEIVKPVVEKKKIEVTPKPKKKVVEEEEGC
jgi:sulfur-carrier protein adenylyltransferase/sulfurtransferase